MKLAYIKLTKRDFNWLIIVIGLFAIVGTMAYSSGFSGGNPTLAGHSSDEINVKNATGQVVSLQEYINQSNNSFSSVIRQSPSQSCGGGSCITSILCQAGEIATGGGCDLISSGTQFKSSRPLDSNGDGKPDGWQCHHFASGSHSTTAYVICVK